MIDINLIRENKELVKENIKKKFQDKKLPLVDEVEALDKTYREYKLKGDNLRALKNSKSAEIGALMRDKKIDEANKIKEEVAGYGDEINTLEQKEEELAQTIKEKMMMIPNIIADDVPIGEDDSKNVEEQRFGEPRVPSYEIPYHSDIMASFNGIDKDASS